MCMRLRTLWAKVFPFAALHRNAYNMVLHKHGDKLYNGLKNTLISHLEEVARKIEATQVTMGRPSEADLLCATAHAEPASSELGIGAMQMKCLPAMCRSACTAQAGGARSWCGSPVGCTLPRTVPAKRVLGRRKAHPS